MSDDNSPHGSALSRLQDGELCWIVFHDARRTEAVWSAKRRGFFYNAGGEPAFISPAEVCEWWSASVPF